jgi:hypothetical protein
MIWLLCVRRISRHAMMQYLRGKVDTNRIHNITRSVSELV